MKSSAPNADKEKEGVRLEMNGGKDRNDLRQKAIVEFLCDGSTKDDTKRILRAAEDEENDKDDGTGEDGNKEGEEVDDGHGGKLKLVSWDVEESTRVLRLDWTTKYGCEDAKDDRSGSSSGHWGESYGLWTLCWILRLTPKTRFLHLVHYRVSAIFVSLPHD